MPYKTDWLVQDHVIYNQIWQDLPEDDHANMLAQIQQMISSSPLPAVHVLSDIEHLDKPLPFSQLTGMALRYMPPKNTGWIISFGNSNPLMKFVSSVGAQFFGARLRIRVYDTQQEALDELKSADDTIDWSLANYDVMKPANE